MQESMKRVIALCKKLLTCLVSEGIIILMVDESKCLLVSVNGYHEECAGQS